MHRGSSNGSAGSTAVPESLPLSASPPELCSVTLELIRGARVRVVERSVRRGTLVRELLRSLGEPPEGCAVLRGETPIPLDTPIDSEARFAVVATFSGG